ncbi:MAG: hypothetical protein LBN30_08110 [Oscillospiraceae bacterium]|nr:hypothetical protein [Oscillospiraceae bacterium]
MIILAFAQLCVAIPVYIAVRALGDAVYFKARGWRIDAFVVSKFALRRVDGKLRVRFDGGSLFDGSVEAVAPEGEIDDATVEVYRRGALVSRTTVGAILALVVGLLWVRNKSLFALAIGVYAVIETLGQLLPVRPFPGYIYKLLGIKGENRYYVRAQQKFQLLYARDGNYRNIDLADVIRFRLSTHEEHRLIGAYYALAYHAERGEIDARDAAYADFLYNARVLPDAMTAGFRVQAEAYIKTADKENERTEETK